MVTSDYATSDDQRHATRIAVTWMGSIRVVPSGFLCDNAGLRHGIVILDASTVGLSCATTQQFNYDDVVEIETVIGVKRITLYGTVQRSDDNPIEGHVRIIGVQLVLTPSSREALDVLHAWSPAFDADALN